MLRAMATLELSSASARTGIVPTNGWRRSLRRQCIVGVCVAELALMIVNGFSALPQAKLAMLRRRFSHNVNEYRADRRSAEGCDERCLSEQ